MCAATSKSSERCRFRKQPSEKFYTTTPQGFSRSRVDSEARMDVRTIGVIGAGPTGRRIALMAILGGYHVILEDVSPDMLEQGVTFIEDSLSRNGTREALAPNRETGTLAELSTLGRADELCRQADFLIETTPEELEVKLEIFTIFDRFAKPGAILASHTRL